MKTNCYIMNINKKQKFLGHERFSYFIYAAALALSIAICYLDHAFNAFDVIISLLGSIPIQIVFLHIANFIKMCKNYVLAQVSVRFVNDLFDSFSKINDSAFNECELDFKASFILKFLPVKRFLNNQYVRFSMKYMKQVIRDVDAIVENSDNKKDAINYFSDMSRIFDMLINDCEELTDIIHECDSLCDELNDAYDYSAKFPVDYDKTLFKCESFDNDYKYMQLIYNLSNLTDNINDWFIKFAVFRLQNYVRIHKNIIVQDIVFEHLWKFNDIYRVYNVYVKPFGNKSKRSKYIKAKQLIIDDLNTICRKKECFTNKVNSVIQTLNEVVELDTNDFNELKK